jgi:hypothetical protein
MVLFPYESSISARVQNAVPAGISADWSVAIVPYSGKKAGKLENSSVYCFGFTSWMLEKTGTKLLLPSIKFY